MRWDEELTSEGPQERVMQNEIIIPPAPRLGNDVVTAADLKKVYGNKLLMDGLSFALPRGGIVGVIGSNGAGKTTLFRMIAGKQTLDAGTLAVGETVVPAYADKSRELNASKNVWEEISGGREQIMVGKRELNSRAYLASFNFVQTARTATNWAVRSAMRRRLVN